MSGSTSVDFAGSVGDARTWAIGNAFVFPRGLSLDAESPNGDPVLRADWETPEEQSAVRSAFEKRGWSPDGEQTELIRGGKV